MTNPRSNDPFESDLEKALRTPGPDERFVSRLDERLRSQVAAQGQKRKSRPFFARAWQTMRPAAGVVLLAAALVALTLFSFRLAPQTGAVARPSVAASATQVISAAQLPTVTPTSPGAESEREAYTYTVQVGQTLEDIAAEAGVPADWIISLNGLDPAAPAIQPGQKLVIGHRSESTPEVVNETGDTPRNIRADSTREEIRNWIVQPRWTTLWAQGKVTEPNNGGGPQEWALHTQIYLARDGRGRVLTSKQMPGQFGFNLDVAVGQAAFFDGATKTSFDMSSETAQTTSDGLAWTCHPLENENQLTAMLCPAALASKSQDLRILREEMVADRPALVVDWENDRLWVDEETGLTLRQDQYPDSGREAKPISSAQITRLVLGVDLTDAILHPAYLDELTFEKDPNEAAASSTPPNDGSTASETGWIYLETSRSAPFLWQMARLPADCLDQPTTCPEVEYLPGQPNLQITDLVWAPDFHLAAFSDTNHSKLVIFDPRTKEFRRVLDIFLQAQLQWSPDGGQIAGVSVGEAGENDQLVIIEREGWTQRTLKTDIPGTLYLYGWLDETHLLVGDYNPNGGLYRVNIETGFSELLIQGGQEAALSPDGETLAVTVADGEATTLMTARKDGSDLRSLNVAGGNPAWSPDGEWIVYHPAGNEGGIAIIRQDGSDAHKETVGIIGNGPVWSPDGRSLLVQTGEIGGIESGRLRQIWLGKMDAQTMRIPALEGVPMWFVLDWIPAE